MNRRRAIVVPLVLVPLALAACRQDMNNQPQFKPFEPAPTFPGGTSARQLPADTVARGDLARHKAITTPPKVTPALVARGKQRFEIYCTPCHGEDGYGHGIITYHGFPNPPSYHSKRLLEAPAQHFFNVITNGYGVMYSYAVRVAPRDRWAIVAYIRALQLSQLPGAKEKARKWLELKPGRSSKAGPATGAKNG